MHRTAVLTLIVCGSIVTAQAHASLIGYWAFNEGAGTTAVDSSGNVGLDGSFAVSSYTTGHSGNAGDYALNATSTNQAVTIPAGVGSLFDEIGTNNQVTLSLWVYGDVDQQPRNNLTVEGLNGGNRIVYTHLPYSNSNVYWDSGNTGCCGGNMRLNTWVDASLYEGQWNFWTFVKDGTNDYSAIYVNGNLIASTTGSTADLAGLTGLILAKDYRGYVDDVAIYSQALSTDTITAMATGQLADGITYSDPIVGSNGYTKSGAGTTTLTADNKYLGATTVDEGTLVYQGTYASPSHVIASGATLELNVDSGTRDYASTTFTGGGTLRKTGAGTAVWGSSAATFAMSSGSLIDVQEGTFYGGSSANENWTNNYSDLNVAAGATFAGVEANVRVDALTGAGTIQSGYSGAGYQNFTFGVDGGSGTFYGVLANTPGLVGNYVKAGSGTQILTGNNTYTGTTTVEGGTLVYQGTYASPSHTIASGATLELNVASGAPSYASTTFYGGGTLRKTGAGNAYWGSSSATFAMAPGAVIDVQEGTFYGGSSANEDWTNNYSDLNVAAGALFHGVEANVRVGALTGEGTIRTGYGGAGYSTFTFGVGDASGTFDGTLSHNEGNSYGHYTKVGTGTQTFTGTIRTIASGGGVGITIDDGTVKIAGAGTFDGGVWTNALVNNGTFHYNSTVDNTMSGVISGSGNLVKGNSSTLTLNGNNTYTGTTTIDGGVLVLNNPSSGAYTYTGGDFYVNNGSTLQISKTGHDQYWFNNKNFIFDTNGGGTIDTTSGVNVVVYGGSTVTTNGGAQNSIIGASGFNLHAGHTVNFDVADGTDAVDLEVSARLWNSGGVHKTGDGVLRLSSTSNTYTGATTVDAGTLIVAGTDTSTSHVIAAGATLELNVDSGSRDYASTSFTGGGTLAKSGAGTARWGSTAATFALGSGSLIDVQAGTFVGGSSANENWTNNYSGLNVAAGATFAGVEANVRVDALTGAGTITSGYNGAGYSAFTFGVAGGSGTFDGVLADTPGLVGNYVKAGSGTQVLTGQNTYTGTTTIDGGTLDLATVGSSAYTYTGGNIYVNNGSTLRITASGSGAGNQYWFNAKNFIFDSNGGGTIDTTSGLNFVVYGGSTVTTNGGAQNSIVGSSGINLHDGNTINFNVADGTGAVDLEVSTPLWNSGGVHKTGDGVLRFSANNTYTGATTIDGGVLELHGGSSVYTYTGGNVYINNGSTLRIAPGGNNQYWFNGKNFIFDSNGGGTIDTTSGLNFVVYGGSTVTTNGGAQNSIIGSSGINLHAGHTIYFNVADGTDAVDLDVATALWNSGGINKTGDGVLRLSSTSNSYTGATTVNAGTLLVDGSIVSPVTVNGGTLGGVGSIGGTVAINDTGTLAPGDSPGILTLTNGVTFTLGSTFEVELNGPTAGTEYDQLQVTGGLVNLGDELATLSVLLGNDPAVNTTFTIIDNQGTDAVQGTFVGLAEGTQFDVAYSGGTQPFVISYLGGDGNNVILTAVPEPSTLAMLAGLAGAALLGYLRRRRR